MMTHVPGTRGTRPEQSSASSSCAEHRVDSIRARIRALPLCQVNIIAIRALAMRIGNQPPSTNLARDDRKNGTSKLSRMAVTPRHTQAGPCEKRDYLPALHQDGGSLSLLALNNSRSAMVGRQSAKPERW